MDKKEYFESLLRRDFLRYVLLPRHISLKTM